MPKTLNDAEVRVAVRREATGLTWEQMGELIAAAGDGERWPAAPVGEAERLAAVRRTELQRIRHLVSLQSWGDEYSPAGDPQERAEGHPVSGGVRPAERRGEYQVLARCTDPEHPGASDLLNRATATSVEEAVVKVHRAKENNLYGPPGLYRVVEVFEDVPSAHARQMLDALSLASAEIGRAAAAAADGHEPGANSELFDVLSDFFHRTVMSPWHLAYPGDRGDGSTDATPHGSDHSHVLARLLVAHLEALDMPLPDVQKHGASTPPQYDADAYGQELARISHHQHEATAARLTVFQALAAVGIGHEQADDIVSKLEAGAVAGAHTWISESSPPHGSEQRFEDGWDAGVRDVAGYLMRIADTTTATTGRGRAASSALLLSRRQQPASPAPASPTPEAAPTVALDAQDVLAAAQRCTWALTDPDNFLVPDASEELLAVVLGAVGEDERAGYVERLEAFAEQHRERLEKLLRGWGPGSRPAEYGRYMLVGQPESLIIYERMETNPFLLHSKWEGELEDVLLGDLEYVWGPRIRLSR
ncbi:hypothetical protein ACIQVO_36695 [Streptomyces sp. NPDC101062]|uniref:hypothetical protein n=1 Tax=unclassified Streptomyces TaxID=2593676 RepID=UPI0038154CCB